MILPNELFLSTVFFFVNHQPVATMYSYLFGFYSDSLKPCTCAPAMVTKYQKRISGPLLDRILSGRAYHRTLNLVRMIADLVGSEETQFPSLSGGVVVPSANHDGAKSWIFFTGRTGDLLRSPVLL